MHHVLWGKCSSFFAIFYQTPTKYHCARDFSIFSWYLHTAAWNIYQTRFAVHICVPILSSVHLEHFWECWMLTQLVIANTKALHIVFSFHQFTHPPSLSPPPTLGWLQFAKLCQWWAVGEFIALPCHAIASLWANQRRQCAHKQYAGKRGRAQHFRLTWWAASRVSCYRLAGLGHLHIPGICDEPVVFLFLLRFSRVSLLQQLDSVRTTGMAEGGFYAGTAPLPRSSSCDLESVEGRPE